MAVLALALGAVTAGCESGGAGVHAVVGEWGAATQSGDLVQAFAFESDGTVRVIDSSGTGLERGEAAFSIIDDTAVSVSGLAGGGDDLATFEVEESELAVEVRGEVIGGFERIERE